MLTPLPTSSPAKPRGVRAHVPRLTARDLAVIFCNIRNLHQTSSELVFAVAVS
jgi:predicted ATPase